MAMSFDQARAKRKIVMDHLDNTAARIHSVGVPVAQARMITRELAVEGYHTEGNKELAECLAQLAGDVIKLLERAAEAKEYAQYM